MSRIKSLLFGLLISPEVVVGLVVVAFATLAPKYAAALGEILRSDAEVWKYLPTMTFIFSGGAIAASFKLRAPLESFSNKMLYQWPSYQLFVDRVYIGLFFGICAGAASVAIWIIGKLLDPITIASIFLAATLISGTTCLTMVLAQQKLRELLESNT